MDKQKVKLLSGAFITGVYYFIAYFSSGVVSHYFPDYKSDMCNPGLDFFMPIFFAIGGLIWTIISAALFFTDRQKIFFKGSFIVNIIAVIYMIYFLYSAGTIK